MKALTLALGLMIVAGAEVPAWSMAAGASGGGGRAAQSVSVLQARVDRRWNEMVEQIAPDPESADTAFSLPDLRAQWRAAVSRCDNDACRNAVLRDQLHRLEFGLGHTRRPIAGIPWRSGIFHADADQALDGGMSLFPIDGGRILAVVGTSARRDARWICDLAAFGELGPDGTAQMRVVGSSARFRLRTLDRGRIRLEAISPPDDPAEICRVGPIFANYHAASPGD